MRRRWIFAGSFLLVISLAASVSGGAPAGSVATGNLQGVGYPSYVPGELIVAYERDISLSERVRIRGQAGAQLIRELRVPGQVELVELADAVNVETASALLKGLPGVRYAEPNYVRRLMGSLNPNDTHFSKQWGLHNTGQSVAGRSGIDDADIDAPEAWHLTTGSSAVTVAVVDTGVAYDHPDLAPNMWTNEGESGGGKESNGTDDDGNGFKDDWRGWDFIGIEEFNRERTNRLVPDNDPWDLNGHGTHVAGAIGGVGDNSRGVTGVNWEVRVMSLRIIDAFGALRDTEAAEAFNYAALRGADVVNASFGGGFYSQLVKDSIEAHTGTLFVAAAGNEGTNNDARSGDLHSYPCDYRMSNVICVAATDETDALADFPGPGGSNYGRQSVDLAAPGRSMVSPVSTAYRGSFGLTDSPVGDYKNGTNSWAQIKDPIDLSNRQACLLSFAASLSVNEDDVLYLDFSVDEQNWKALLDEPLLSSGGYYKQRIDLGDYKGYALVIYLRFRLASNGTGAAAGVNLDDVRIACGTTVLFHDTFESNDFSSKWRTGGTNNSWARSNEAYEYYDGTSMATPLVAGVAALYLSLYPNASVGCMQDALLKGGDRIGALVSKTVTGRRLNAFGTLQDRAPSARMTLPNGHFQVRNKFRVAWAANDCEGDVTSQEVRFRKGAYNRPMESYKTFTSGNSYTARLGDTVCFSTRAQDAADHLSAWSETCTVIPLPVQRLDDSAGWRRRTTGRHYEGSAMLARTQGATLTSPRARVKYVALVVTKCPGCGVIKVEFGSKTLKNKVKLNAARTRARQIIMIPTGFNGARPGKVTVEVVSPGRNGVLIEGLGIGQL